VFCGCYVGCLGWLLYCNSVAGGYMIVCILVVGCWCIACLFVVGLMLLVCFVDCLFADWVGCLLDWLCFLFMF